MKIGDEASMPKFITIILMLPLLCCSEVQQFKPIADKKTEQIELTKKNTENLEIGLENKLKNEYKKKFGVPISDFELSIKGVYFTGHGNDSHNFLVTRTATGALAKYRNNELELELNISEWLNFINALHKCNVSKWKKEYGDIGISDLLNGYTWELRILSSEKLKFEGNKQEYPPNWDEFIKVMSAMEARIKKDGSAKLEAKLKAEYKKRFGIPISDFELSIRQIIFYSAPSLRISATRTTTGATIEYKNRNNERLKMELDMYEWLDFVNVLHKSNVSKWKKEYHNKSKSMKKHEKWLLHIHFLDKNELIYSGINAYPPNWSEFQKLMDDMVAKIKEKSGAE
ncbi:MAG: hypothetical protein LBU89_12065 [Fibromonadaceae bacterium]|jgi:hypothetical protein|nr:hypothetical protein [Fibromonadaceae bacterium]